MSGAQLKIPEAPDTHPRGPSGAGLRTGVIEAATPTLVTRCLADEEWAREWSEPSRWGLGRAS